MKIQGRNLVILYRVNDTWKAVAYATVCELDISADMLRVGSIEPGPWKEYRRDKIGWTLTAGHLMSDTAQDVDLETILVNGTKIKIFVTTVQDHPLPGDSYIPKAGYQRQGDAYVNRFTVTSRNRDYVTGSVSMQGTGPLDRTLI